MTRKTHQHITTKLNRQSNVHKSVNLLIHIFKFAVAYIFANKTFRKLVIKLYFRHVLVVTVESAEPAQAGLRSSGRQASVSPPKHPMRRGPQAN